MTRPLSLADKVRDAGPLDAGAVRRLGAGLVEALLEAHRAGLVYQDLEPRNVLVAEDGLRLIGRTEAAGGEATAAADVYALGAVLVFAATGQAPTANLAAVPEGLREVVARCLAADPGDRPSTDELLALFDDGGVGASELRSGHRKPTPKRDLQPSPAYPSRRKLLALGVLALTGGGVFLGVETMPGGDTKPTGGEVGEKSNAATRAELPTARRAGQIGGPLKDPLWTRPVLGSASLLTAAGGGVLVAGKGITAFDGATGGTRWSVTGDRFDSLSQGLLPVDGDTFYELTIGGELDALSLKDTSPQWSAPPPADWLPAGLVGASPEAVVVWALSTSGITGDPGLWAADPRNRRPMWSTPLAPFDGVPYYSAGAGLVLVSRPDKFQLAAYSVGDGGGLAWTAEDTVAQSAADDAAFATSVTGHGENIYWAANRLYALDKHGQHLWPSGASEGEDDGMFHAVVADADLVYAAAEVIFGTDLIVAYKAADGAPKWRTAWPKQFHSPSLECEMALGGGNLYIVDRFSQTLVALDAATGETLWQYHETTPAKDGSQYWHVAADDTHVYIGYGTTVRAFTAK